MARNNGEDIEVPRPMPVHRPAPRRPTRHPHPRPPQHVPSPVDRARGTELPPGITDRQQLRTPHPDEIAYFNYERAKQKAESEEAQSAAHSQGISSSALAGANTEEGVTDMRSTGFADEPVGLTESEAAIPGFNDHIVPA